MNWLQTQSRSKPIRHPSRSIIHSRRRRLTWMKMATRCRLKRFKTGVPVTVFYENENGNLVADKVVVRKTMTTEVPVLAPAPTTTTTTVSQTPAPPTAEGIVRDADSDEISIRTGLSEKPIHYKAHEGTAYVDENGNPISRKILTRGTPVTIFYEQRGDDLLATRVVVKSPALLK